MLRVRYLAFEGAVNSERKLGELTQGSGPEPSFHRKRLARRREKPVHQCQRPAHCSHYHQRTEKNPSACKQCFDYMSPHKKTTAITMCSLPANYWTSLAAI